MLHISLNLLGRYRLNFSLERRRGKSVHKTLVKTFQTFVGKRGGTKTSRALRFLLDRYNIKNILGTNLILLSVASSFINIPTRVLVESENVEVESPVVLSTKKGIRFPLKEVQVTQRYWALHRGVDLDGKTGDPIYPMARGVVEEAGISNSGYGKMVLINHENGYKSLYAHLSKIEVAQGQEVNNDTEIGKVGATGHASGDHLHMEVYEEGKSVNPLPLITR